ncbi:MAG: DUF6178 family protein [Vicinamibacterales bacterium]
MPKTTRPARGVPRDLHLVPAPAAATPSTSLADAASGRLLDRLLDTPDLERVVPRLPADLLHRVVQQIGLEDSGELLMLATPPQLAAVFDLDLWRANQPGQDELFDGERFGLWLQVLVQSGAAVAARQVAQMDADLVVAGISHHVRVVDVAAGIVTSDDVPHCNVSSYRIVARQHDAWDAIVAVLTVLDKEHPAFFHRVMEGCRALSDSTPEVDGLDELLGSADQAAFDLAVSRERRRQQQGYATPAQAGAFLKMARQIDLAQATPPGVNPLARAYATELAEVPHAPQTPPAEGRLEPAPDETTRMVVAVLEVLREAGVVPERPRALLEGTQAGGSRVPLLEAHLRRVLEHDPATFAARNAELAFLVNTLAAAGSVQGRPLTVPEAVDAAAAICNLGLENWPRQWRPEAPPLAAVQREPALEEAAPVDRDLVTVFQVGFRVLHRDACLFTADGLQAVLKTLRWSEPQLQADLKALRLRLTAARRDGTPWTIGDALEAIQFIDMPAWATLRGLIAELPVLHAGIAASRRPGTLSVDASAFEFISENSQLASVRTFVGSLAKTLGE